MVDKHYTSYSTFYGSKEDDCILPEYLLFLLKIKKSKYHTNYSNFYKK